MTHLALPGRDRAVSRTTSGTAATVLVACPDARPPAYQAAIGLSKCGRLGTFVTGFYDRGDGLLRRVGRRLLDGDRYQTFDRMLRRRHHPELPEGRVRATYAFDAGLAVERRLDDDQRRLRRAIARWRTDRFDRGLAVTVDRQRPDAVIVFSDVGSRHTLPACRQLGIPTILSMVHGDVREERRVLQEEARRCPEGFGLYLGDGTLDLEELNWLHERRLRDLELADLVLVPSEHIADELRRHGTPDDRIRVIPYAADTARFRPSTAPRPENTCTFLFAGGICQRKGIVYLLRAWQSIRRPGWRLQLLGAPPRSLDALDGVLDGVELLGRVPHAEVPDAMANADVFVFPSLFEGSAVVTYEALACGLPCIVTPSSGSVARNGVDGIVVPPGDVEALAGAMVRLGTDEELRGRLAVNARTRAEAFDWPRYHRAISEAVIEVSRPKTLGQRADIGSHPDSTRRAGLALPS